MAHTNAYMRAYRAAHQEQIRAASRKWANANPENRIKWKQNHPSFTNWQAMMRRCYDPKDNRYKYYGARGICVDAHWHKFPVYEKEFGFLKPSRKYTVDRIDNDGHYEQRNVQWLTRIQNNKKRFKRR